MVDKPIADITSNLRKQRETVAQDILRGDESQVRTSDILDKLRQLQGRAEKTRNRK